MIIKIMSAWMLAVVWSIMIRKVLGFPADHILNWGGVIVVICSFLAMARLFSTGS